MLNDPENAAPNILEDELVDYHSSLINAINLVASSSSSSMEKDSSSSFHKEFPIGLIHYLDEGINPDEYLREVFRACVRDNQMVKGRAEMLSTMAAKLQTKVESVFPDEAQEYRQLKGDDKETKP
eukprot:CAMPEP_0175039126 /NCGR_PEP_ID=MMETSP0052_2-20121109/347_1 /TAXON_ID=51329 ORGANISM="Polytomella parva, Strain SAG 63-3" /NCGR_SAMPLE_ID=MMETSP0052_2 /ASSEMBLY_ACC=CAM_ASM_000194 /LENGTH=124 /DNA_ID=CAMNT_0016300817 /DNA_START=136 /DNA_END=510 /DNA_ORIENTATION=+